MCDHLWKEAPYLILDKIPKHPKICVLCGKEHITELDPKSVDYNVYDEEVLFADGTVYLYKKII